MLHNLGPGSAVLTGTRYLPPVLSPLIGAAERGESIDPIMRNMVRLLGFDTFLYGASLSPRPGQEAVCFVYTTMAPAWVARYDERGYVEVDPRVLHSFDSALPFVWDQKSERGRDPATDVFLDDALTHGSGSGVSFSVRSGVGGYVLVAFNSSRAEIDDLRRFEISRNLGDLVLLGTYFHELFMKTVVERGLPPKLQGAPLSAQERRCLALAAHGCTSREIAQLLKISERTVELYFAQVRAKLGVRTRNEAVGKAIDERIIRRGQLPDGITLPPVNAIVKPILPARRSVNRYSRR